MPHFFATHLTNPIYPINGEKFTFLFEAESLLGKSNYKLILAKSNQDKILLLKQKKGDKILIKYNKNLKNSSKENIKDALKEYANITNANIIAHNLSSKIAKNNHQQNNPYLQQNNPYLLSVDLLLAKLDKSKNNIAEIGFGSGRHLLNLAKNSPDCIFIGIEVYRPAILQILRQIEVLKLTNLYIINADCRILFNILSYDLFDRIYMHFPIPWDKNPQKRVLSSLFLQDTLRILKKDSYFELRTDSKEYYLYAKELTKTLQITKIETAKNTQNTTISKYEARWLRQNKDIYTLRFYKTKDSTKEPNKKQFSFPKQIHIENIIESPHKKITKEDYFLHIKDIYRFQNGYILFIILGSYFAPTNLYLMIKNETIEILGDFIPTKANLDALNLIGVYNSGTTNN